MMTNESIRIGFEMVELPVEIWCIILALISDFSTLQALRIVSRYYNLLVSEEVSHICSPQPIPFKTLIPYKNLRGVSGVIICKNIAILPQVLESFSDFHVRLRSTKGMDEFISLVAATPRTNNFILELSNRCYIKRINGVLDASHHVWTIPQLKKLPVTGLTINNYQVRYSSFITSRITTLIFKEHNLSEFSRILNACSAQGARISVLGCVRTKKFTWLTPKFSNVLSGSITHKVYADIERIDIPVLISFLPYLLPHLPRLKYIQAYDMRRNKKGTGPGPRGIEDLTLENLENLRNLHPHITIELGQK